MGLRDVEPRIYARDRFCRSQRDLWGEIGGQDQLPLEIKRGHSLSISSPATKKPKNMKVCQINHCLDTQHPTINRIRHTTMVDAGMVIH